MWVTPDFPTSLLWHQGGYDGSRWIRVSDEISLLSSSLVKKWTFTRHWFSISTTSSRYWWYSSTDFVGLINATPVGPPAGFYGSIYSHQHRRNFFSTTNLLIFFSILLLDSAKEEKLNMASNIRKLGAVICYITMATDSLYLYVRFIDRQVYMSSMPLVRHAQEPIIYLDRVI